MRRPKPSKNDARNLNLLNRVIHSHSGSASVALGHDVAPFRDHKHRIVQPEMGL